MRIRSRIPTMETKKMRPPATCPYESCQGKYFKRHQCRCTKSVRDTRIDQVVVYRRKCLSCGRTHRVYPQGVSRAQQSNRLKGFSIFLYILGISYRGVEDAMEALGFPIDHTTVYHNVQAAGEQVKILRKAWMEKIDGKVSVVGGDLTYVQCRGEKVAIAVAVDAETGLTLDVEVLENEETETIEAWLKPVLEIVDAEVLITDDQDSFKTVADNSGVSHQICRQHVTSNVMEFIAKAAERILSSPLPVPDGIDVTPEQLLEDLAVLEWIMLGHPDNAIQLLEELYDRYATAPPPRKGKKATIWYRMRNHILRLWNHWKRYTCFRRISDQKSIKINETNNVTEGAIGWNIKERYRTMRGYKRTRSITNVAHLTAWLREEPGGREMNQLYA